MLALLLLAASALAQDVHFTFQTRVLDSVGTPVTGDHTVRLSLYTAETGGSAEWSKTYTSVPLSDGYVALIVEGADDDGDELDAVNFSVPLYMGIGMDSATEELGPRQRLGTVLGLNGAASGPGVDASSPAVSCQTLKDSGDSSGWRYIDPNGGSVHDAYHVYCEQTHEGGGWAMCAGFDPNPDSQRGNRIPNDLFAAAYGNPSFIDGTNDRHWGSNCTKLFEEVGATEVLLRTSAGENAGGDWWRLTPPGGDIRQFYFTGEVNNGTVDGPATVVATNTSWGQGTARVDWDGNCGWGTCAQNWHLLESSSTGCANDLSGGGGINIPVGQGCWENEYNVSCGVGNTADSRAECDNQWIRMGVR